MTNSVRHAAVAGLLAAGLVAATGLVGLPVDRLIPPSGWCWLVVDSRSPGPPGADSLSIRLGPAGSDTLQVSTNPTRVPAVQVRRAEVTRGIEAALGRGDDTFTVVETGGIVTDTVPTSITGGDGADHLVGGSGGETLRGGPVSDRVDGRGGPDGIILGAADDTVVWTAEDGVVDGGSGTDLAVIRVAVTGDRPHVSAVGGGVSVSAGSSTSAQFWDLESREIAPLTGSDDVLLTPRRPPG